MKTLNACLVTLLLLICALPAICQTETATLSGRVTDPQGAVVSAAQIQVQNELTGQEVSTKTNASGIYVVTALQPSKYRVIVSNPGFKQIVKPDVILNVQDNSVLNFGMEIGSASEVVTVQAGAPLLNTQDATVKTVVERNLIQELPLNGRSFQTLFELTPGVTLAPTTYGNQGQFSINGQRTDTNYFTVDGASANFGIASGLPPGQSFGGSLPALGASGGTNSLVSIDAVQEFAIQTSSYAAEFGRTPGGQVSIVTRSGTNDLHGEVFDYLRNDVLDANSWFANHNRLQKPKERQNDFGGTFGGPIFRNHTFFFVSYEGLRLRQPVIGLTDVPCDATCTVSGDIRSKAPAAIQPFLKAFPLPNGADHGNGLAQANYTFSNPTQLDSFSVRLDHRISTNLSLFARYSYAPSQSSARTGGFASLNSISEGDFSARTLTVGLNGIIASTVANEVRFNWSRSAASSVFHLDAFAGAVPLSPSAVFPMTVNVDNSQFEFGFLNGNKATLDFGPNANSRDVQFNLIDNVSWQRESHLFKIGIDYKRLMPLFVPLDYAQANFFSGTPSALAQTVNLTALFSSAGNVHGTVSSRSVYAQDTWRPKSRLTLTYGIRWDYNPAPTAKSDSGVVPIVFASTGAPSNLSFAPAGTPLYQATKDNVAPRVGVSYQLRSSAGSETVVRSGFGTFYDLGNGLVGNVLNRYPFFTQVVKSGAIPFPLSPQAAARPVVSASGPFPAIQAFPGTLRQPYVYHWNLSLEQSLGVSQSVTIGYVGSAGHSLTRGVALFPPSVPSAFSQVLLATNGAYSNYNALQVSLRRRATRGLNILASYTYAHSLDNASDDQGANPSPQLLNPSADYGPSDFDIRHTASAGADYQVSSRHGSPLTAALLNGWGVNMLFTVRTSPPVNVTFTRSFSFGQFALRPNVVPGQLLYLSNPAGGKAFNPNAFSDPGSSAVQGDFGRNGLRGFGLVQQDFSVRRTVRVSEKVSLQGRLEAFNIFNHPNFASPSGSLGSEVGGKIVASPTFGISQALLNQGLTTGSAVQGVGFSPLYQLGGPRSLQASLKVVF